LPLDRSVHYGRSARLIRAQEKADHYDGPACRLTDECVDVPGATGRYKNIIIAFPNGIEIEAEVADTPEKLLFGMAFQDALPRNSGMIYIFESTGPHRVTTKEYRFPIDMIWVDESRHIVSIAENVPPCRLETCPWHGSTSPSVRYLIQTAAGFAKQAGVEVGGELKYTLRL
jgi:uncharacterized membrane protein (UPF0127 family)